MVTPVCSLSFPAGYARIKTVDSLHALVTTPFADGINALCWPRTLPGNFCEVLEALPTGKGIVPMNEDQLAGLSLSDAGRVARDILLTDLEGLRAYGLQPELDCVYGSEREAPAGLFHTDVASWHVDTATVPADTFLCTYVGACSEGLPNAQAQRRVDVPATRAELLRLYVQAAAGPRIPDRAVLTGIVFRVAHRHARGSWRLRVLRRGLADADRFGWSRACVGGCALRPGAKKGGGKDRREAGRS